jgi:hypothetical protein
MESMVPRDFTPVETLRPSGPAEAEGLICQSLAGAMTSFDF